jgi:putative colanic acid biosysnthesis UDP-glucose lipid carrier transferase
VKLPAKGLIRGHEDLVSAFRRCADCVLIAGAHLVACAAQHDVWRSSMTLATVVAVVTFNLAAEWRGLYRPFRAEPLWHELRIAMTTWLVVPAVLLTAGFVTKTSDSFSRMVTLTWFAAAAVALTLFRVLCRGILRKLRASGRNSRTVAVVGATPISEKLCRRIQDRPWLGMRVTGIYDSRGSARRHDFTEVDVPFAGTQDDLLRDVKAGKIDIVYIGLPLRAEKRITDLLELLADTTATVCLTADFFAYDLLSARWHQVGDIPAVSIYDSPFAGIAGWLKRLEDIVLGSLILTLIAIPMMIVAVAVKVTSPGPVFFRQRRFGLNGKPIRVLKFRTMSVCEDGPVVIQAKKHDARITRLGAFLRRTSIDELPQFLQVITGEMSIVGPRPHAIAHNEAYRALIKGYMLRHKVRPGITGWAQVNGFRGETDTLDKMENRVKFDLEYIAEWHLGMDLKIILLTLFGAKTKQSAY